MARRVKPLTANQVIKAKPKEKKYKLSDGGGLFLQINPNGSKLWRLSYRIGGKAKEYAIGTFKDYSLEKARKKREELRGLVANGIDINDLKKQDKKEQQEVEQKKKNTFYKISQDWHRDYIVKKELSESYASRLEKALINYVYPFIKDTPIEEITRKDIIEVLEHIKNSRGLQETAHRMYTQLNSIFMYAVTYEYIPTNIVRDIDKSVVLGTRKKKHYPTFTKEKD